MTSTFATNFISRGLSKQKWLETDAEGVPLQRQVPLTYQIYNGQGNETITYDGSNCLVIENTLTSGDLTVDFSQMHNYFGRAMHLVIKRTLANDFIMDFGSGSVIVPGVPMPLGATITPAGFGPASGALNFFAIDQAALVKNTVTIPDTIIPGTDGQFLGTVAGSVEWTDLPSTKPKTLSFPWLVDANNELNANTALEVVWNPASSLAQNDTDLTITTDSNFTVVTATKYTIDYNLFVPANLDVCLRSFISIDSDIYNYTESSFGLTGQRMSGSLTINLTAGKIIRIFCGNADGPDSGTRSITPSVNYYGTLNITQFS